MILGEGRRPLYGLLAFGLAGAMGFLLGVLVGMLLAR